MSPRLLQFEKRSAKIEANIVTGESAQELAKWARGDVTEDGIAIPTMQGIVPVSYGDYVCREFGTGRFFGMDKSEFHRLYVQTGLR